MTSSNVSAAPSAAQAAIIAAIGGIQRKRIEAWMRRDADAYLSFYWDDAVIFAVDKRTSIAEFRRWMVALFAAGGGSLTMELPPVDDIAISSSGDAAVASFIFRTRFRSAEGIEADETNYETNVWYRRDGVWKIIGLHLTCLALVPVPTP
jgi:ketosteroid isomerase-like protein